MLHELELILKSDELYDWTLFAAGILIIWLLRMIIKRIIVKWSKRRDWNSDTIVSLIDWIALYAIIIWTLKQIPGWKLLDYQLFEVSGHWITPMAIIIGLFTITLGIKGAQLFTRLIMKPGLNRYDIDSGLQYSLTRITQYIIISLAAVIGLMNMGFNLSALTVLAGMAGIGIGFGLQNISSNFFSGIILLFERPFKIGDIVRVDDLICEVEEIKMRATIVRSFDNERIIVPNSMFVENQIVNLSYGDETVRLRIPVGVAYGSDVELVRKLLLQAAHETRQVLKSPACKVFFLGFGDSSLDFQLFIWVAKPLERLETKSDLYYKIYQLFSQHQVEISFPQRDLHVRSIDAKVLDDFKSKE
jgi:small-conductance mechanosensitive channel